MSEPLPLSLQVETWLRLEAVRRAPEPVVVEPQKAWIIVGDEELAEWNYQSRTNHPSWTQPYICTPSVQRYYPEPREKSGDYRVDISPLLGDYLVLNGEDSREDPKSRYLFNPGTALFNSTGYPQQAYVTMQGNELMVVDEQNGWYKFQTLRPTDKVRHMTNISHPHFVHRFDLVCWDNELKRTYHKPVRWGWEIYYFLITREGYAWMPVRYVKQVER